MEDVKHRDPDFPALTVPPGLDAPDRPKEPHDLAAPVAPPQADRKVRDNEVDLPAVAPLALAVMSDDVHARLRRRFPALGPTVDILIAAGKTRSEAWLLGGAILAYTGIASIESEIINAVGLKRKKGDSGEVFPKVIGSINDALRGGAVDDIGKYQLLAKLFTGLSALPDYKPWKWEDPTRMMHSYPGIDEDYAEGNVVIMGEVGSVNKSGADRGYYTRQYRLHFTGGLKDVSACNPAQREVIYAPGTAYLVTRRRVGKHKVKKGNQSHVHIYLTKVKASDYPAGKIKDKRAGAFKAYT